MSDHSDSLVLLSCTDLLDWQGSYCRLVVDGQAVHLTDVSDTHQTRAFLRGSRLHNHDHQLRLLRLRNMNYHALAKSLDLPTGSVPATDPAYDDVRATRSAAPTRTTICGASTPALVTPGAYYTKLCAALQHWIETAFPSQGPTTPASRSRTYPNESSAGMSGAVERKLPVFCRFSSWSAASGGDSFLP